MKIHGVPLSVHTRKVILAARLKEIPYELNVVIPVIPGQSAAELAQDFADRACPCDRGRWLHPRRLQPRSFSISNANGRHRRCCPGTTANSRPRCSSMRGRASALFRSVVHPVFHNQIVAPNIRKVPRDKAAIDHALTTSGPEAFAYLESLAPEMFLVGGQTEHRRPCRGLEPHHLPLHGPPDRRRALSETRRPISAGTSPRRRCSPCWPTKNPSSSRWASTAAFSDRHVVADSAWEQAHHLLAPSGRESMHARSHRTARDGHRTRRGPSTTRRSRRWASSIVMEVPAEETGDGAYLGYGEGFKPYFWMGEDRRATELLHVAFAADTPRQGRRVLQGGDGGGRSRQRSAGPADALSSDLLRRVRARSRRAQHRGRVPRTGLSA